MFDGQTEQGSGHLRAADREKSMNIFALHGVKLHEEVQEETSADRDITRYRLQMFGGLYRLTEPLVDGEPT